MVCGHALFPHRLCLNPRPNIFPTSVKNYTLDYLKKPLFRVNIHCARLNKSKFVLTGLSALIDIYRPQVLLLSFLQLAA